MYSDILAGCRIIHVLALVVIKAFHYKTLSWKTLWLGVFLLVSPIGLIVFWVIRLYPRRTLDKHAAGLSKAMDVTEPTLPEIEGSHSEYKSFLNALPKREFDNVRFYGITEVRRSPGVVSRSYYKLRDMLQYFPRPDKFVDLCAGRGGWTHACLEQWPHSVGHAASFWSSRPKHELWALSDPRVTLHQGDIGKMEPFNVDLILFDGGESYKDADEEDLRFAELLGKVVPWIVKNPKAHFCLKILCPGGRLTRYGVKQIQGITGKGRLVRSERSRLSNAECYLLSDGYTNIDEFYPSFYRGLMMQWAKGIDEGFKADEKMWRPIYTEKFVEWEPPAIVPDLVDLPPLDLTDGVKEFAGMELQPPRRVNRFLREIGYLVVDVTTPVQCVVNPFVDVIIGKLKRVYSDICTWRGTNTATSGTYGVVLDKVDAQPTESHAHVNLIHQMMLAIGDFLIEKKQTLTRLDDAEIGNSINRVGGMGRQERNLGFANLGEYFNSGTWRGREKTFRERLLAGKPILSVFNTMGKAEKKKSKTPKGSRLIWFLPGTARIYELRTLGRINTIIKKLPFCFSGVGLEKYGEKLWRKFKKGWHAVCDDVAGWDTKVSHTGLRMQCEIPMRLARSEDYKKEIRQLYRLYANMVVGINRPRPGSLNGEELAIYQLMGMVGSGINLTLAMNTNYNGAITLARMHHSIEEKEDPRKWALKQLRLMDSVSSRRQWDMGICGDDSIVMGEPEMMRKFASKGGEFMNQIGMPRKGVPSQGDSPVYTDFEKMPFCSHVYQRVPITTSYGVVHRYMPCRPIDEILGKARLMLGIPKDRETYEAWARAQAFQLLTLYPHISDVRMVCLSILSSTSKGISLMGITVGVKTAKNYWLQTQRIPEILSMSLDMDISKLDDIGYAGGLVAPRGVGARREWKRSLWATIKSIRYTRELHSRAYGLDWPVYEDSLLEIPIFGQEEFVASRDLMQQDMSLAFEKPISGRYDDMEIL